MTQALTHEQIAEKINKLLRLRDRVDDELAGLLNLTIQRPIRRRSRNVVPNCGTEEGYQWHRYRGQKCDECKAAHAEHTRLAYAKRRAMEAAGVA